MTPLEERFRARLEIYKQQKGEISRDKNLKKRLDKLVNENDYQQQRRQKFAKVKNIAGTMDISSATAQKYVRNVGGVLGGFTRSKTTRGLFGQETKTPKTAVGVGGRLKTLAKAQQWTTEGYRDIGDLPNTKRKPVKPPPRASLKWRMQTFGSNVQSPYGSPTPNKGSGGLSLIYG